MSHVNTAVIVLLVCFYLLFLGRTLMLMARGINPFALGKGKRGFPKFLELFFLIGLLYWTFELSNAAAGWQIALLPAWFYQRWFESVLGSILGPVLMAGGLGLFGWALLSFGASWRIGIDGSNPGELVTAGAFAFSRNPIFVAVDLYLAGAFLAYGNRFFLLAAVIGSAGIHYQILQEERFLRARHGEAYATYQRRVRRYL
jgi:protein-S-isoprenylcysteine O-methyltransferase Ste14